MATKKEKTPPPPPEETKAGGEAAEAAPAKKGGKLKLIIIVVAAMAVGGGGAFAALKILGGGSPPPVVEAGAETPPPAQPGTDSETSIAPPTNNVPKKAEGDAAAGEGAEAVEPAGPVNIEFKTFVVNLGDGKRFLKLTMSVEADTPELEQEINAKMPQFRDIILLLLSSLAYDDIATLDGKMRLRGQMLNRINTQLSSGKIKNIYFSEFVVQ